MRIWAATAISLFLTFLAAPAEALIGLSSAELQRYDLNGNGLIDAENGEQSLLLRHLANPVLRAYDKSPMNGRLDSVEIQDLEAYRVPVRGVAYDALAISEIETDLNAGASRAISYLADDETTRKKAPEQRLYLRSERINASVYNKNVGRKAAKGAMVDIGWSPDTGETIVGLSGVLSYVWLRNRAPEAEDYEPGRTFLSGYSFLPWLEFDWRKSSTAATVERNRLIAGLSAEFELFDGPLFGNQVIQINPSYHTDFDLDGQIYSLAASWSPYNTRLGLGNYQAIPGLPGIRFTWSASANVDYRYVADAGYTNLVEGDEYTWLGTELGAKFEIAPVDWLQDRLYAEIKSKYYYDLAHSMEAWRQSASLSYNLDTQGLSALTLAYDHGRDHRTGRHVDEVKLNLGIKY